MPSAGLHFHGANLLPEAKAYGRFRNFFCAVLSVVMIHDYLLFSLFLCK